MSRKIANGTRRSSKRPALSRSQIMSRIKGKDTLPEMLLRRALRARGIGYRLHGRGLPGRPDVFFSRARLAVFVHGCFWHRHPGCRRATVPRTSTSFWIEKFDRNVERDRRKSQDLERSGWRVGILWECEAQNPEDLDLAVDAIEEILRASGGNGSRSRAAHGSPRS